MSLSTDMARRIVDLEQQIRELTRAPLYRPIVARYTTAAGQSIPNTTPTIIDFGTVTFDPDSHVTVGAAWKFTAKVAGYYQVNTSILYASTTTWALGEWANLAIYKGGVYYTDLDRDDQMNSSVTGQYKRLQGSDVVQLAVGEYIDIRAAQVSGGALVLFNSAVFNYVSIAKIN